MTGAPVDVRARYRFSLARFHTETRPAAAQELARDLADQASHSEQNHTSLREVA